MTGSEPQTRSQRTEGGPGGPDGPGGPGGRDDRDLLLEPHPRSAGGARAFVATCLGPVTSAATVDTAVLLASELVTNAVLHARGTVRVRVQLSPGEVRIEVLDTSPTSPTVLTPRLDATGGRGLVLVQSMSRRWGSRLEPGGKVVWFELAL